MDNKQVKNCEIDNNQKYLNYTEQLKRLTRAMNNEFYLEAVFIEYAIIEDRVESILRHAGTFNPEKHNTLDKKLSKLSSIQREKAGIVRKYVSDQLLESVYEWKNKRNPLCHALLKQELATDYLRDLSTDGQKIAKELCNKATSYRRFMEKNKQE